MFCHYQYYRNTYELQSIVDHSDEKYQCKEMSDCPYTGTNIIQKKKIPLKDWKPVELYCDALEEKFQEDLELALALSRSESESVLQGN